MNFSNADEQRAAVKAATAYFCGVIDGLAHQTSKTRELSLARTKIEEAELWALRHVEAQL